MNISVLQMQGKIPVTVIKLDGQLDGQTYQDLINKAREAYQIGWRDFLIDMTDLTYISSAGLVALHSVALLAKGDELPNTDAGWSAYRSMGRSKDAGMQKHMKLLNPRAEVNNVLDMVGFNGIFEVFTDLDEAVSSFKNQKAIWHTALSLFDLMEMT